MLEKVRACLAIPELRQKILLTLFLLAVYRIGYQIALPVVDQQLMSEFCLLYTSPSPRDATLSRMPSSA